MPRIVRNQFHAALHESATVKTKFHRAFHSAVLLFELLCLQSFLGPYLFSIGTSLLTIGDVSKKLEL